MKPLIFGIVPVLIVSTLSQSNTSLPTILVPPSPTTALVGQDVEIFCEVSGVNGVLTWKEFASSSTGKKIWVSAFGFFNSTVQEQKYEIIGHYNLKIKNIQMSDGGSYGCTFAHSQHVLSAPLVVLDDPQLIVPRLEQNKRSYILCIGYFKGPVSLLDLEDLHIPKVNLYIGDKLIGTNPDVPKYNSTIRQHYAIFNYTYRGKVADNGKDITCVLRAQSPQGKTMKTEKLDVKFPVSNIHAPDNGRYSVGDNITCTADGNPVPTFKWKYVEGPGQGSPNGAILKITEDMKGFNIWTCTATNNIRMAEITVSFKVATPAPPGVIAVAVIIPLIVIGVLVFVVLFVLRYRARRKTETQENTTDTPLLQQPDDM